MDSIDNFRERFEALEQQAKAMETHTGTIERRLRWWRGLACGLLVLGLLTWALPSGRAGYDQGDLERRVAELEYKLQYVSGGANEVVITRANLRRALSQEQLEPLFAQIQHPMDRALFLLMLRCGLRVSEAAQLKLQDIDWSQQAVRVEQGKGRKDRQVYLSADAVASLQECLKQHPQRLVIFKDCSSYKNDPHIFLDTNEYYDRKHDKFPRKGLLVSFHP